MSYHVARWWPPMRVSRGSNWTVTASTCCPLATCARVEAGTCSRLRVAGGRWRGRTGRTAQPTEASGECHHQRCLGTRAGAKPRGAPRGARAERAGVRSGVREKRHRDEEVPWRHVWRPPPPLPHPSSIGPRPHARRATRWRCRVRSDTPLRRDAADFPAGGRRQAVVHGGRTGARRWLHAGAMRAESASRCAMVGHVRAGQKPACAGCVQVPRNKGWAGERLRAKVA